ncbi:RNA polymerase II transcription mediator complex subunit 9-domain-containing protein [Tirmania nivea]|nr:RNA polymerase II transcription mediator complex subunit 9-domain-containing protein [Tirmania nivea]
MDSSSHVHTPPPASSPTNCPTSTFTQPSPLHSLLPTLATPLPQFTPPPLPPPNTFDFLPPLHSLISKVYADDLPPQGLSDQANPIRIKLVKARQLVLDLPDMSRSIDEQKEQIRELEERIEKQRRVIREALEVVRREIGKGGRREWE